MGTLIQVSDSSGIIGRCDSRCYNAKEPECNCCCGGVNHGVGIKEATANTEKIVKKELEMVEKFRKKSKFPMDTKKQNSLFVNI